jgi:hypothetical protein
LLPHHYNAKDAGDTDNTQAKNMNILIQVTRMQPKHSYSPEYLQKFHKTKTTKQSIIQSSVAAMFISLPLVYDISYWITLLDHDTEFFYQKVNE